MATRPLESLRAALAAMPPGTLVPRDWLLDQLTDHSSPPSSTLTADLTIPELARLFGKRPSTVRAWVERGDFEGAYKLQGKQWRVPAISVAAFQQHQQQSGRQVTLSAWRAVKRPEDRVRSVYGQHAATTRPSDGHAKD